MAANSTTALQIATFGKRFLTRFTTLSLLSRRCVHGSVYDKNVEENVEAVVVPDDLIQPESDKYWAPNPETGVFGPAGKLNTGAGGREGAFHSSGVNGGREAGSVLEEKAFIRPQENLEKPQHA